MEDFKNCMLGFLKLQEKQRQEDLKRLNIFSQDLQRLNIFSQESVINSVDEFIYKPEVTFEAYFRRYEAIFEKDCEK